ncbi:hypothetical protein PIB30_091696 [Stylosanthes scabra]|uniref:Putative plant transposon protein domain-containing protein n=1 Tax=Stylosanthes scabra TaxID=79078 RepID=A0ABU6QVQ7_9FABA|nr:hypothetical protein [Stylosanthes scabra]
MTNLNHPKYFPPTPRRQKQRLGACKPTSPQPASRLDVPRATPRRARATPRPTPRRQTSRLGVGNTDYSKSLPRLSNTYLQHPRLTLILHFLSATLTHSSSPQHSSHLNPSLLLNSPSSFCITTFPALTPFSAFFLQNSADSVHCLRTSKSTSLVAPHHQEIYQKYIHKKGVTPKKSFDLQEGQYPEFDEQIQLRGWRRLSKPRTKISKDLVLEFYTNAVRTEEELATGEDYPYTSFVRGTVVDFSAAKIREVLRIRHMTLGAETDFKTRQYEDQRLDEVIRDISMPGAQWKMSSSYPPHPIQLRRQDLTPVARGWVEFIIHSMIPTGNKSEIIVARAVLIHSIIKGHDVRVEELIADNIAVLAEGVQGRSKLCFPSTIYRLCKEAGVPMGEFRNTNQVQVARPIIAKGMTTTRGRIINQPQNQPNEENEDNYDAEYLYTNHE